MAPDETPLFDDRSSGQASGGSAHADGVEIEAERVDEGVVLHVSGDLDLLTTSALTDAVAQELRGSPAALVIDLSGVGFIASRGLEALVIAHQSAGEGVVRVVVTTRAIMRPLSLTGLLGVLRVYESVPAALAADTEPERSGS